MTVDADRTMLARVRAELARRLQEEPGLPWLSDTEPLAPAGVDSVLLISVIGELEQELGVTLPDDTVLESASISSLALALSRGVRP
ncbi:acyl carrier protein [Streptomyces sp. I05A-00742]|uniref:acyl carrier protein n=1 Tax=Streptomyces sp. I05A-00742 TaxID=2732853 RepID=UPI0028962D62|nr:acyl carrier protein [Streptomyces sp. I05A-00742]